MAFSERIKKEIEDYCNNHLADDSWYENEFSFIQDIELRHRIITEFKAIRFAYKLYEGIGATDANLMFEVRNQILAYASIYEAVIENVLTTYYYDTAEFESLMHYTVPVRISIPQDKMNKLQDALSHDGKEIVPFYYCKKEKQKPQVMTQTARTAIYNAARGTGAWGYVEPLSQTPTWVHMDRRYGTPACSGTTAGYPTLRRGSRGCYVMILQDALSTLGYQTGSRIDGIFGARTEEALKGFQRRTSLRVDGVCGCNSWKKISTAVIGVGRTKTTID